LRKKKKPADQMKLWESALLRAFWQPRSHDSTCSPNASTSRSPAVK
jgi:hypothetical protein